LWLAEHHFQHEGYECIPTTHAGGAPRACDSQNQDRLRFNIAPMWHPLRCQDYATADILTAAGRSSGGPRLHTREVETFGAPMLDQNANRELFEEQVEIIFKAFNEESFSHKGKYYTLPPRFHTAAIPEGTDAGSTPDHRPVECCSRSSAPTAWLDFMFKHGIKGAVGGGAATMQAGRSRYQEAAARVGKHLKLGEKLQLGLHIHLAKTREQAAGDSRRSTKSTSNVRTIGLCPGLTRSKCPRWRGAAAGLPPGRDGGALHGLGSWFAGARLS